MITKQQFLDTYKKNLIEDWNWAKEGNPTLNNYMQSVKETLCTLSNTFDNTGHTVLRTWKELGMKGKPTYKALRALSE